MGGYLDSKFLPQMELHLGQVPGLRTVWEELGSEFLEIFNLCAAQSLWVAVRTQELAHPLTQTENNRMKEENVSRETIAEYGAKDLMT